MGRLRERVVPLEYFESFIQGNSFRFSLTSYLALPGSESLFGLTQGPPLRVCTSFSQNGFQHKGFWEEERIMDWRLLPSVTSEEPFCICIIWEVSLTSQMRNMWLLYLLSKWDSAPSPSCHCIYHGVSVHRGQVRAAPCGTQDGDLLLRVVMGVSVRSLIWQTSVYSHAVVSLWDSQGTQW